MRTAITDVRPPGIYTETTEKRFTPIRVGRTGVVGFVGLAERGPTNQPVKITSVPQFYEVFGDLPEGGFLAPAVEAFFKNGGRECRVVRVAHHTGRSFGEFASSAAVRLLDRAGLPTLEVRAASEGLWGNQIVLSVRLQQPPRAQTILTLDAPEGATEATIRSTHGFRPGTLIKLSDGLVDEYRLLIDVEGKTVRWADERPLAYSFSMSAPTYVETVEFELNVSCPFARERFSDLSMDPASPAFCERVLADRSRLVRVRSLQSPSPAPANYPADASEIKLTGGLDGLHNVTPDDFIGMSEGPTERTGLAVLELVEDVDLLAIPDLMWLFRRNANKEGMPFSTLSDVQVVQDAMISQCERLNDRFAILDSPFPESADRTREYRLLFDTRFAALYFPWIVTTYKGQRLTLPPSGHIAGIFARCDEAMGVHRAPANEVLEGADDLSVLLKDEDVGYLNAEGINCIKSQSTRGLRVWGARAMSSDPQFRFLNVRRVLNAINRAMNHSLQWVVFEFNLPSLWKTIIRNVNQFLMELWSRGWFCGDTPEEAFFVKCDEETNPPEVRDAGLLIVEVGVAPIRPAEFLTLRVAQEMQEHSVTP